MAHEEQRQARMLLPEMPHPPLDVRKLLPPARPPIQAVRALPRLVERGASEPALVVREDGDAPRGILPVRPFVPPDVLSEAMHEEDYCAWGAGSGGVRPGVELGVFGAGEPGFGVCGRRGRCRGRARCRVHS